MQSIISPVTTGFLAILVPYLEMAGWRVFIFRDNSDDVTMLTGTRNDENFRLDLQSNRLDWNRAEQEFEKSSLKMLCALGIRNPTHQSVIGIYLDAWREAMGSEI